MSSEAESEGLWAGAHSGAKQDTCDTLEKSRELSAILFANPPGVPGARVLTQAAKHVISQAEVGGPLSRNSQPKRH